MSIISSIILDLQGLGNTFVKIKPTPDRGNYAEIAQLCQLTSENSTKRFLVYYDREDNKVDTNIDNYLSSREKSECENHDIRMINDQRLTSKSKIVGSMKGVFDGKNKEYWENVKGVFSSMHKNYNVILLTFGPSGSGKTYTCLAGNTSPEATDDRGLITYLLKEIGDKFAEQRNTSLFNAPSTKLTSIEIIVYQCYGINVNGTLFDYLVDMVGYSEYYLKHKNNSKDQLISYLQQNNNGGSGPFGNVEILKKFIESGKKSNQALFEIAGCFVSKLNDKKYDFVHNVKNKNLEKLLKSFKRLKFTEKEKDKISDEKFIKEQIVDIFTNFRFNRSTPNNPNSSRSIGFIDITLNFEVRRKNGLSTVSPKIIIIDMPGNENRSDMHSVAIAEQKKEGIERGEADFSKVQKFNRTAFSFEGVSINSNLQYISGAIFPILKTGYYDDKQIIAPKKNSIPYFIRIVNYYLDLEEKTKKEKYNRSFREAMMDDFVEPIKTSGGQQHKILLSVHLLSALKDVGAGKSKEDKTETEKYLTTKLDSNKMAIDLAISTSVIN